MWIKALIIILMLLVIGSLAMALVSLVRDSGKSQRTVRSLTVRVALSCALFLLLLLGLASGIIKPHSNPLGLTAINEEPAKNE